MRLEHGLVQAVVAISVAMLLGHVCTVPKHAYAGTVTTHDADQTPGHAADAADGASCDTATTSPLSITTVDATSGSVVPDLGSRHVRSAAGNDVQAVAASRPLFLLHAALLI